MIAMQQPHKYINYAGNHPPCSANTQFVKKYGLNTNCTFETMFLVHTNV